MKLQRPANGQPGGRSTSSGTRAGDRRQALALARAQLRPGAEQAAAYRDACDAANTASVGPLSTTLPPYITIIRCDVLRR